VKWLHKAFFRKNTEGYFTDCKHTDESILKINLGFKPTILYFQKIFIHLYCFINQFSNQNIRNTLKRWLQIETFVTFSKVKFFTVRFEDEETSETDKFFNHLKQK
jgi:hypothetical protein